MNKGTLIDSPRTVGRRVLSVLLIGLAVVAFIGMDCAQIEAGWYKDAKKKAKKAAKKAEAAAKKAGRNIENEIRTGGVAGTIEKAKSDVRNQMSRSGGDFSRESKRFIGDTTRQLTNPGGYMTPYDWVGGLERLGENLEGGFRQGWNNLETGAGRALPYMISDVVLTGCTGFKPGSCRGLGLPVYFGPGAPWAAKGVNDLFGYGGPLDRAGRAIGDELNRGGLQREIFGHPKVTDTKASNKDEESPTGEVANPLTGKRAKGGDGTESSSAPVAIFRKEKSTDFGEPAASFGGVFRERTTSGLGSSTGSPSKPTGLSDPGTSMKREQKSSSSSPSQRKSSEMPTRR